MYVYPLAQYLTHSNQYIFIIIIIIAFPGGSHGKESGCNAGDPGLNPGLGRSPEDGKWQPTPVFLSGEFHGGVWQATIHRVAKSQTQLGEL